METDKEEFRSEVLALVDALKHSHKYAYVSPKQIHSDLRKIDRALTAALQVLVPMDMCHAEGQDLESHPFNWHLVAELAGARTTMELFRVKGLPSSDFARPCYPTKLLMEMVELRDAARFAAERCKPSIGNGKRRTATTSLVHDVGSNFVFRFRCRFGHMPPITKAGWVVDVLQEMLDRTGLPDADASQVLRWAIQRDEAGRELPKAKDVSRRAK